MPYSDDFKESALNDYWGDDAAEVCPTADLELFHIHNAYRDIARGILAGGRENKVSIPLDGLICIMESVECELAKLAKPYRVELFEHGFDKPSIPEDYEKILKEEYERCEEIQQAAVWRARNCFPTPPTNPATYAAMGAPL